MTRVTTRNAVTRATVQGAPPSLADELAPIWSAINRLQARQMSIFPATVTSVDPVRIRIDGEGQSLAATPDIGTSVYQGARVRVIRYGTTHLVIAIMGSTPWRSLNLAAGWSNVSSTEPAQRRKVGDEVQLRGEIVSNTQDAGSARPITILPAGWRPRRRLRLAAAWGDHDSVFNGAIVVESDGRVWLYANARTSSPGTFLDGIRFSTAEA